jgi:phosphohistidine phosphatase
MKLFILRHAVAEERRPDFPDSKRALTEKGRAELKRALLGMKKLKVRPEAIVSSRYRRAWDTAVEASLTLLGEERVSQCDALKPGGAPAAVWAALKHYSSLDSLMIVGHEPLLSEFAAFVLSSPQMSIKLKKSGLIRIDVNGLGGNRVSAEFRWLLTPQQLAAAGL